MGVDMNASRGQIASIKVKINDTFCLTLLVSLIKFKFAVILGFRVLCSFYCNVGGRIYWLWNVFH